MSDELVVAVDVGGTWIKGALIDRLGTVVQTRRTATPRDSSRARVDAVAELIAGLADGEEVVAVGLAVPGVIDESHGVVRRAVNLDWVDLPIAEILGSETGYPVTVGQDAEMAALAEQVAGSAQGRRDWLLVSLGTGVGAALSMGGERYRGAFARAGELGHLSVEANGRLCACGRRGCLETRASAGAIARIYCERSGEHVTAAEVCKRSTGGDELARSVWDEAIAALSGALSTCCALLDPELIVLAGGLAESKGALIKPLERALAEHLGSGPRPALRPAALGLDAGCMGAGMLAWLAHDEHLAGTP